MGGGVEKTGGGGGAQDKKAWESHSKSTHSKSGGQKLKKLIELK